MTIEDMINLLSQLWNYEIFKVSDKAVTISSVVIFLLVVIGFSIISKMLQRLFKRGYKKIHPMSEAKFQSLLRLFHYAMLLIGLFIGLQVLGIDISSLFTAGAIFAVGIGFAMQNIAQNFVSGVILLLERAIKPGDVLEVEGRLVMVRNVGIRATIVRTKDEEDVIIPNAVLVQSSVINYTLEDNFFRTRVQVGVSYSSDLKLVRKALEEAAKSTQNSHREPVIYLVGFGDSTVNYEISVWIDEPWRAPEVRSNLMESIWWAFKKYDIEIAFPQLDLHVKEPLPKFPIAS